MTEAEIERVMRETGMARMQAINHLRQREYLIAKRDQRPERSIIFKAWRGNRPVENCAALEIATDLQQAIAACEAGTAHKAMLYVLQDDAGLGEKLLAICRMRQESKTVWRRNPVSGIAEPTKRKYAEVLTVLPVLAFEPKPPFDALKATHAEIVGIDPNLVEQKP